MGDEEKKDMVKVIADIFGDKVIPILGVKRNFIGKKFEVFEGIKIPAIHFAKIFTLGPILGHAGGEYSIGASLGVKLVEKKKDAIYLEVGATSPIKDWIESEKKKRVEVFMGFAYTF